MSGAEMIAAERQRQIDAEGYTPDHDTHHGNAALAWAAVCYAAPETVYRVQEVDLSDGDGEHYQLSYYEPWPRRWRRPQVDRLRELTKAGALIAAEIDRLQATEAGAA